MGAFGRLFSSCLGKNSSKNKKTKPNTNCIVEQNVPSEEDSRGTGINLNTQQTSLQGQVEDVTSKPMVKLAPRSTLLHTARQEVGERIICREEPPRPSPTIESSSNYLLTSTSTKASHDSTQDLGNKMTLSSSNNTMLNESNRPERMENTFTSSSKEPQLSDTNYSSGENLSLKSLSNESLNPDSSKLSKLFGSDVCLSSREDTSSATQESTNGTNPETVIRIRSSQYIGDESSAISTENILPIENFENDSSSMMNGDGESVSGNSESLVSHLSTDIPTAILTSTKEDENFSILELEEQSETVQSNEDTIYNSICDSTIVMENSICEEPINKEINTASLKEKNSSGPPETSTDLPNQQVEEKSKNQTSKETLKDISDSLEDTVIDGAGENFSKDSSDSHSAKTTLKYLKLSSNVCAKTFNTNKLFQTESTLSSKFTTASSDTLATTIMDQVQKDDASESSSINIGSDLDLKWKAEKAHHNNIYSLNVESQSNFRDYSSQQSTELCSESGDQNPISVYVNCFKNMKCGQHSGVDFGTDYSDNNIEKKSLINSDHSETVSFKDKIAAFQSMLNVQPKIRLCRSSESQLQNHIHFDNKSNSSCKISDDETNSVIHNQFDAEEMQSNHESSFSVDHDDSVEKHEDPINLKSKKTDVSQLESGAKATIIDGINPKDNQIRNGDVSIKRDPNLKEGSRIEVLGGNSLELDTVLND